MRSLQLEHIVAFHEPIPPGIRGASDAVKKQYRSMIAAPKLSSKNAVTLIVCVR